MSRMCQACGGLVPAMNEVLSHSGPLCSGLHSQIFHNPTDGRLLELELRVAELTRQLSQRLPQAKKPAKRKGER